ncbi:MAG: amidohydrolase, partial [Myxococcaceae bacterium]|nr:amidohydrolase [Myxococcaceae bacterium]
MLRLSRVLLSSLLLSCTTVPGTGPELTPPGATEPSPPTGQAAQAATPALAAAGTPEQEKEKKEEWDVSKVKGPTTNVDIDVTEGTWMSVDVSPKGDVLTFELLGDIYLLPLAGGEAKALTSGPAWDMQPRFSPDGESIAFTSDRSGGDNLWVMKRDGTGATQVTKETFRLVNSPTWSPDGQFLVGRKHYTAKRSLGAGELWMYHRAGGGEGVQLIERPNEQKDLGEPAFSPDGRYVYFSQDTTPGKTFEYNKDANGQIYVIKRLDRETGDVDVFLNGPGGSVRPTPSPDGKSVAFVRRVRNQTVLFLADVESGVERPLWNGLERDMQETWAIHGVYPAMGWTPDGKALVLWAKGKLHRVDVQSRKVTQVPFHVKARHTLAQALRFRQEVAPSRFPVRMVRWAQVSPDGKRVVFQALGHLYVKELPGGAPRRLTRQTEHLEFYPSFSRDGRSIVYTTWDDEALGTVRVVPVAGGEGRVLTRRPGHYLEPAFSPDGKSVVFRASGDGYLRPGLWGREQGLFVVSAEGGAARRLQKAGESPHFGARSDRVYFLHVESEEKTDKRTLRSIALDGTEERTHLGSEEATEYRVSPDERWVAFRHNFQAWVMPFPRGAKGAQASPGSKALPQTKVTRDAGEFLHWSGDGKRLHWTLGPDLYTRELKDAFSFLAGAPEKLPPPPEQGVRIGFDATQDTPEGTLALVGGRVITMRGDEVLEGGVVVVQGG